MKKNVLVMALMAALGAAPAIAAQPTTEEKMDILQQEVEALREQFAKLQGKGNNSSDAAYGMHGASLGKTTIGGYGEIVLNNYRDPSLKDEADLKRFVLFFGHKFNERLKLVSELEVEHAKADKDGGEVAMEQAYLEYGISNRVNARAGMMLMPLGIINETHEPPLSTVLSAMKWRAVLSPVHGVSLVLPCRAKRQQDWNITSASRPRRMQANIKMPQKASGIFAPAAGRPQPMTTAYMRH